MYDRRAAADFIRNSIERYVNESLSNRLPSFDNEPIFDDPVIGFADADDPIFQDYKGIIGEYHLTPREAFSEGLKDRGIEQVEVERLSVVSWSLPISLATRLSMRRESQVPSLRWNHTRFQGQDFINDISRHLISQIEKRGLHAVAPEIEKNYTFKSDETGLSSNWSQRHIAYAAGLGTFSLNDALITPKGIAMRLGSIVTDMDLPVTPRTCAGIYSNCLFYRNGSCGRCIKRCPAGAISEKGHDKNKCLEYVFNRTKSLLQEMGRFEGFIGSYPACGMCQTKVPCEGRIPPDICK
jgi:epoxyqueuosine reductase QueG